MQEAIESFGGVLRRESEALQSPVIDNQKVRKVSNIQYSQEGLRVWRAYNTGPGKFIPWRKFDVPDKQDVPSLVSSTFDSNSEVNFAPVKLRRVDRTTQLVEEQETIDEDADNSSNASLHSAPQNLFLCPEEGCIKSYQRHSLLQKHLEYGEHKRALEYETLLDRELCWGTRQGWKREQAWCLKYHHHHNHPDHRFRWDGPSSIPMPAVLDFQPSKKNI